MSLYEESEAFRLPRQDYEPIGLSSGVPEMFRHDIEPANPDRYENAGIWAGLIVEAARPLAARSKLAQVDVDQLSSYVWDSLVAPVDEADPALPVVKDFARTLGRSSLSTNVGYQPDDYSYFGFYTLKYDADEIADYVERKLEYEEISDNARSITQRLRHEADETPAEMFILASGSLDVMDERRRELNETKHSRKGGRWFSHDSFSPVVDEQATRGNNWLQREKEYVEEKADSLDALERVLEVLEPIDETLHYAIGAKGANLARLKTVTDGLKQYDSDLSRAVEVPPFTTVTTDVYEGWLAGERITGETLKVKKWIDANGPNKAYIVRSSAVYSEDGEHTGAGIYDSVLLPSSPRAMDVFKGMVGVYRSTVSERALAYQQEVGVEHEKMGLVIQEVPDDALNSGSYVTINTIMPHVPQLADYKIESGGHPLLDNGMLRHHSLPLSREGILQEFGSSQDRGSVYASRFHVPPDTNIHYSGDTWYAAQAGILAEKVFGKPVQAEVVIAPDPDAEGYGEKAYLVQARPLPEDWLEPHPFSGFPEDEEHWFHGNGVGVYDGVEATVVPASFLRSDFGLKHISEYPEGPKLIEFQDSFGESGLMDRYLKVLHSLTPEEKREVICLVKERPEKSGGSGYGHLETLFSEMGVGLVFYGGKQSRWQKFAEGQKVRVYSNGFEAKLYADDNDPAYIEHKKADEELWGNDSDED